MMLRAQGFDLNEMFGVETEELFWKKMKKAAKKVANVGKKVVKGTGDALKIAGKVGEAAAPFVPQEYQDQYKQGMSTIGQAQ
jgi:hypothetical protein